MPVLIGARDDTVRTLFGHVLRFTAGEETVVPNHRRIVAECLARGHTRVPQASTSKPAPAPAKKQSAPRPRVAPKEATVA